MDVKEIRESIMQLLVEKPYMIMVIKSKILTDDMWAYVLEQDSSLFKYNRAPSESLCRKAVKLDGNNLQYVPEKYIDDMMALDALVSNPSSIIYIPEDVLTDELKEYAFSKDPSLINHFDKLHGRDILKLIKNNPSVIRYVNNPSENMICEALKYDPYLALDYRVLTNRMKDVLSEFHPHLVDIFPNFVD